MGGLSDDPVNVNDVTTFPGSHFRGDVQHSHSHFSPREGGAGRCVQLPDLPIQCPAVTRCPVVDSKVQNHKFDPRRHGRLVS